MTRRRALPGPKTRRRIEQRINDSGPYRLRHPTEVPSVFGIHDLWLFVLSGLLLNITPGPDTLYIVGRSSTQGSRAGAVAALGIGAGALVHICAAALGLSAILAASATAFTAVKIIGAAYLVYVGVALIRSKSSTRSPPVSSGRRPTAMRGIFLQGFFTNVLNPKV